MLFKMCKEEFEKVYEIIAEAFPTDERRTFDEERELLSRPNFEILVWKEEEEGDVKGFLSLYRLDDFCFAEHFAVSAKYRNEGIGQSVLRQLLATEEQKICLEVEPPVTEQARRRIGFYRRNGFFLNEYPYIQPPLSEGTKPVPLLIMTSGAPVGEAEFLKIKEELYRDVYGL